MYAINYKENTWGEYIGDILYAQTGGYRIYSSKGGGGGTPPYVGNIRFEYNLNLDTFSHTDV